MSASDLPQYVEFGGNPRYQAPFTIQGCRMYNFVLAADYQKLHALFSKCLNTPSGGAVDFWPVGLPDSAYVLFSFVDMQHQSAHEPTLGWIREQEFTIFVLGVDLNSLHNRDTLLAFFIPYIFVDSDAALIVGREDYGFPKRLGWLTFPPPQAAPTAFSLDTLVIPGTTPDTQAERRRLIDIRSTGEGKLQDRAREFTSFAEMSHEVANRVFDGHLLSIAHPSSPASTPGMKPSSGGIMQMIRRELATVESAIEHVGEHLLIDIGKEIGLGVPLVFLKQFRDTQVPDRACYQSIVASSFELTKFTSARLLGDYQITLCDYPSDPIREDFGFPQGPLTPKLSFYVEYDFIVPPGHELWRAKTTG